MKNLAGKERWIILKTFPRPQTNNPKLNYDDDADVQERIRLNRLKSENMVFDIDEILIRGLGDLENCLFSVDNDHKFCCRTGGELNYFIEQGFIRQLPYTREEMENLKKNWLRDPVFDLYEFPGADEYWDELKEFQDNARVEFEKKNWAVSQNVRAIAEMPITSMNYETFLIGMIAARESDPEACIKQADDIIFAMAPHQYNLQFKEVKKDGKQRSKRTAGKNSKTGTEPATSDN